MTAKEYVESGKHLPPFLRDFHDQKDFFKMVHGLYSHDAVACESMPDWVKSHCYVIDWFLWYLGRHGWTLQRSRAKVDFESMDADLERHNAETKAVFANVMAELRKHPAAPEHDPNLLDLRPGEWVDVLMDDRTVVEYEVDREPWQLGHGTWVVGLKGRSGGYALYRVLRRIPNPDGSDPMSPEEVGADF